MAESDNTLILESFLPFRLNRLSESISLRFAKLYRQHYGMTRPEWRTLAVLGQHGRLTATNISDYTTMHKTKVSRAVQSLAVRGWVTRQRDQDDRRVEHLSLTRSGQTHHRKLTCMAREFDAQMMEALGDTAFRKVDKAISSLEDLDSKLL